MKSRLIPGGEQSPGLFEVETAGDQDCRCEPEQVWDGQVPPKLRIGGAVKEDADHGPEGHGHNCHDHDHGHGG